ncbi:cupredoxin domain-containing protein [Halorientalis salina]|uniref:cupredoxin domain-containing protein n=1 Tax=Halorientalis salina TaxID=2932266 RepID=UPI0010AD3D1A|nr:plastocyanin/azurin family copper-binding protein [Halorientalis salina]
MPLDRRAILRLGSLSLAGVVAGCADQGGDATETGTDEPVETTEITGNPGGMVTDTETTGSPSGGGTESPGETTPGAGPPLPSGEVVEMDGTAFAPMELSVDPVTEVRWVNRDGVPHDVTSAQFNDGATAWEFESETLEQDEETAYTFEEAGTYEYYCSIHGQSTMCGVVLVGDAERAGSLPCE